MASIQPTSRQNTIQSQENASNSNVVDLTDSSEDVGGINVNQPSQCGSLKHNSTPSTASLTSTTTHPAVSQFALAGTTNAVNSPAPSHNSRRVNLRPRAQSRQPRTRLRQPREGLRVTKRDASPRKQPARYSKPSPREKVNLNSTRKTNLEVSRMRNYNRSRRVRECTLTLSIPSLPHITKLELLTTNTFGVKNRRASKSLTLGSVLHKITRKNHFLIAIQDFNPNNYQSSTGIRLFVEQFIKLMANMDLIQQAFKSLQRNENIVVKLNLGFKIIAAIDSRKSNKLFIQLFKDNDFSKPTHISVSLSQEEWRGFLDVGHDLVMRLARMKRELTLDPNEQEEDTKIFHMC